MSSKEGGAPTKGGRGKPKASKSVSRSQKAALQFPVGKIARFLKAGKYAERVGAGAPVHLSAVLEYLAAEVRFLYLFAFRAVFLMGGCVIFLSLLILGQNKIYYLTNLKILVFFLQLLGVINP